MPRARVNLPLPHLARLVLSIDFVTYDLAVIGSVIWTAICLVWIFGSTR
jgi:hypothetical protein